MLLGGRLNPSFSINGEMRFDVLNFKDTPSTERWEATEFEIGLSPLFHAQFPAGNGEFVIGPRLAFAEYELQRKDLSGFNVGGDRWSGWSAGFNAGVFFALGRVMSLGGMLSFTSRNPTEECPQDINLTEHCVSGDYASENVFAFTGALLF